ncbi:MAG: hypothetical protein M0037_00220 [Betaproteobacteria bacterium]|nr:hypothetical protein [Betaproteobacteria bacterium]
MTSKMSYTTTGLMAVLMMMASSIALAAGTIKVCKQPEHGMRIPKKVAGKIVHENVQKGTLTLLARNGRRYQFRASKKDLRAHGVGTAVTAKVSGSLFCRMLGTTPQQRPRLSM